MTIWSMRVACLMPKATNTHSACVILIAFHCNNGYTNYVIHISPFLFKFVISIRDGHCDYFPALLFLFRIFSGKYCEEK